MDLLQKYGHLKSENDYATTRRQSRDATHQTEQFHFNSLLGSFGTAQNDHPERRSSGAGNNMSDAIKKAQELVKNTPESAT
ncbi:hypothetical protein AWENTII_003256 [Aspergillus wentii]|nr:hypothetical protein MW887_012067 [Aspergillus wentii]